MLACHPKRPATFRKHEKYLPLVWMNRGFVPVSCCLKAPSFAIQSKTQPLLPDMAHRALPNS